MIYEKNTIELNQHKYLNNIIIKYNKQDLLPVTTPSKIGVRLEKNKEIATKENIQKYQKEVRALLYLSIKTRPNITYTVNKYARFISNPNPIHFIALNRI